MVKPNRVIKTDEKEVESKTFNSAVLIFSHDLKLNSSNEIGAKLMSTLIGRSDLFSIIQKKIDSIHLNTLDCLRLNIEDIDYNVELFKSSETVSLFFTENKIEKKTQDFLTTDFFNSVPGYVSWVTKELKYILVNNSLAKDCKMTVEDFIGKEVGFLNVNSEPLLSDFVKDFFLSDESFAQAEVTVKLPNRKNKVNLLTARKCNNGQEAILISVDITELKDSERLLREQEEQLYKAARLVTIGELASNLAHEVNNPLCVISGIAQRLSGQIKDNEQLKLISKIDTTVDRITRIINGIKKMVHDGKEDDLEETLVNELLYESAELIEDRLKSKNIVLNLRPAGEKLMTFCQKVALSQVIVNLISNSIDAIQDMPDPWILIEAIDTGCSVKIRVMDSGSGIPTNIVEKIMQPLYTTKGVGKGTGLGLSISQKIVQFQGGTLEIDTECENTCFVIELPIASD